MVKAFGGTNNYGLNDFPIVDLLVITHDHYDHLDFKTIAKINSKVKKVITPLGVGEHLEYWGINPEKMTELDWWESKTIETEIQLTATPARHFSGRSVTRGKTLWASYVLEIHGIKFFLAEIQGDDQFKVIGKKHGPFDLVILESGQYGKGWPSIHMLPEETVQAAKDLGAKVLLPVHWSKFTLALHEWNEPIRRILKAAGEMQVEVITPKIGELYTIGNPVKRDDWWIFE